MESIKMVWIAFQLTAKWQLEQKKQEQLKHTQIIRPELLMWGHWTNICWIDWSLNLELEANESSKTKILMIVGTHSSDNTWTQNTLPDIQCLNNWAKRLIGEYVRQI